MYMYQFIFTIQYFSPSEVLLASIMSEKSKLGDTDNETKGKRSKPNTLWFPFLLIIFCVALEFMSSLKLPQQGNLLKGEFANVATGEQFSVQNARENLVELTGFGPRVTGAVVTEQVIPRYLINKVKKLTANKPSGVVVEIDTQNPASNFYLDFLGGITNVSINIRASFVWCRTFHPALVLFCIKI
jgi:hypothetical protein